MAIQIKIDKKRAVPAFRQIVEKIAALIGEGSLKPGHKLPTERELAESLGLARGTITRAYVELEQAGLITRMQGRGSTVSGLPEAAGQGRKEKAAALITALVEKLDRLRFSLPEMKVMIDLAIREREEKLLSLNVAAVDCNPETLGSFERQIGMLSHVSVRTYLLDELARDPDPARRLGEFDLVLTTTTHHPQLVAMAPRLSERILAVAVSPSRETVMQLATVKPGQAIGVLCESRQFLAIIGGRLKEMRIAGPLDALFPPGRRGPWQSSSGIGACSSCRRRDAPHRPGRRPVPCRSSLVGVASSSSSITRSIKARWCMWKSASDRFSRRGWTQQTGRAHER